MNALFLCWIKGAGGTGSFSRQSRSDKPAGRINEALIKDTLVKQLV
jgi:hypothetical protein